MRTNRKANRWWMTILLLAVCAFLLPHPVTAQEGPDKSEVVIAAQGVSVNSDRPARFELNREIPEGFILDWVNWMHTGQGKGYAQLRSADALQGDQRLNFRGGWMGKFDVSVDWDLSPHRYGDNAVFLPGMVSDRRYLVPGSTQLTLEDPDGNGIPFYAEPGGVDGDNALANGLLNEMLDSSAPFNIASRRRMGGISLSGSPTPSWNVDFDYQREWRDGSRPYGTGTYQRIKDGYDYLFSVRGQEMPATIDYVTTQSAASASWSNGKGFVQGGVSILDFSNDVLAITADSPFWNTDTLGNSGIKRGLWETGRGSMPPSNDSWNLFATGGWVAGRHTQITATINRGRINQDVPFTPFTTNTALIGTRDINGDGVIDAADDPTSRSTLAQPNLGASIDTTMFGLVVTTRPVKAVKITGRVRTFNYDATQSLFNSGWRAEYLESQLKPDMGRGPLNHVPVDFQRNMFSVEGVIRGTKQLKFVVLGKWFVRDYDQYVDTAHAVYDARTAGTRAVDKTTDATFGAGVIFGSFDFFSGRLMYEHASRDFDGDYQRAYTKENTGMRQFDISVRKRNTLRLDLDFMPVDVATFGVDFWYASDDYPEAAYGVQSGDLKGVVFDVSTHAADAVNIFAFVEWSQMNTDAHLRTKCSNCTPPPGASWTTPWGVPNFDWFTTYVDTTVAFGAGILYETESSPYVVDLKINYVQGVIEQTTRNPGPPIDLINGDIAEVALGYDFPDQDTNTFVTELRVSRKLNDFATIGLWYLFENFDLDDFMWDPMNPYGANYLDVDDATRFLLLDARYTGYSGNVIQGYVNLVF